MATQAATEFMDATTADAFIAEIWSKEAIIAREQKLIFAPLVDRRFEKEMKFGDTIHVPSIGNLTAVSKDRSANAATLYETITETNKDIVVSTWNYSAIAIEDATAKQVTQDLVDRYAPKQAYALGIAIDDVLAGLVDDFSQNVGTLTQEISYDTALAAVQALDDSDTPQTDRQWVISPAQRAGFMKLDQFVHDDYKKLNSDTEVAPSGAKDAYLGSWMKVPVYMSTNVEGSNAIGHDNGLFHKEALALVIQMSPNMHEFWDIDYFALKVATEQLHGSAEMRDEGGVWVKGA